MSRSFESANNIRRENDLTTSEAETDSIFHQPEHPRVKVLRLTEGLKTHDLELGRPSPPPRSQSEEDDLGKLRRLRSQIAPGSPRKAVDMPLFPTVPAAGFQALILCGPGAGLNTFTSNPEEYPKALVSVGNRPMVWYVLDWCYRMGVSSESIPPKLRLAVVPAWKLQIACQHSVSLHASGLIVLLGRFLDSSFPVTEV